jgi:hypothetical protein
VNWRWTRSLGVLAAEKEGPVLPYPTNALYPLRVSGLVRKSLSKRCPFLASIISRRRTTDTWTPSGAGSAAKRRRCVCCVRAPPPHFPQTPRPLKQAEEKALTSVVPRERLNSDFLF